VLTATTDIDSCEDLVQIDGNDVSGTLTISPCDDIVAGHLATVVFDEAYDNQPRISLTAKNPDAAGMRIYSVTLPNNSGFEIHSIDGISTSLQYEYDYIIIGAGISQQ